MKYSNGILVFLFLLSFVTLSTGQKIALVDIAYVLDNMRFPLPTDQPKLAPEHRHKEEKEEDSWDEIKEDFLVGRSSMADDSDLW